MTKIQKIAIIGAGTMGNGIAHLFAQNNFAVSLVDVSAEVLEKALETIANNLDRQIKKGTLAPEQKEQTLAQIRLFQSLEEGAKNADLVIEAATENPSVKAKIFEELHQKAPENAILATNTSSISITSLAGRSPKADKMIGMHFMNPVPMMPLIEVIRGYATSDETTKSVMDLSKMVGKSPVEVNDYPGFISNRILLPMLNEAIYALFEGVAGVLEIDQVMRLGMAHPMGPLRLADFIGLDVCLAILEVLQKGFGNPKYAPCPLLVNMVNAGHLGLKTGIGFYNYTQNPKEPSVVQRFHKD